MTTNDKHTPGPYRIGDAGHTIFGPPNGNPSPATIASVKRPDDARYLVNAANAYPALVAALRLALSSDNPHASSCPGKLCNCYRAIGRAVLAQAEGGK